MARGRPKGSKNKSGHKAGGVRKGCDWGEKNQSRKLKINNCGQKGLKKIR